ncbi:diphthine synthase [Salinarchaeum sp. Harcht-Bsk1]|uniref:diphthine synthase n=1 Tax=Salinarchaeum sp. Harcht-Bsk1 TaxID=1333523 RepID=UPI0003422998|nr:diphthine synthase [Salinarchaeum sp. Harcht-Bsk1]AGN02886.1 diphthine synthase [Salinarchaeum sp. Harcht-Bsk1]
MLTFVGLGLYDEDSITRAGEAAIADADAVFAEFYTSKLLGATVEDLESHHDVDIDVRDRAGVEQDPEPILEAAESGDAVFLTAGDTMIATTHVDLRLRAASRGIETRVVHGVTAQSAASSLTGLQNYRFGPATTLPFPDSHGADGLPASVTDTIEDNRDRGLHTLVFLDIKAAQDRFMTADRAAALLAAAYGDLLGVVVARAGSPEPLVVADSIESLADRTFGEPLHLLVVPGDLHAMEADALAEFGGAPNALLPDRFR